MHTESVPTTDLTAWALNELAFRLKSSIEGAWTPVTQNPKCGRSSLPAEPSAAEALRRHRAINEGDVRVDYTLRPGLRCKCPVRLKIVTEPFPTYSSSLFPLEVLESTFRFTSVRSTGFAVIVGFGSCKSFEFMPEAWLDVALGEGGGWLGVF